MENGRSESLLHQVLRGVPDIGHVKLHTFHLATGPMAVPHSKTLASVPECSVLPQQFAKSTA